jgi:hypothetical protein
MPEFENIEQYELKGKKVIPPIAPHSSNTVEYTPRKRQGQSRGENFYGTLPDPIEVEIKPIQAEDLEREFKKADRALRKEAKFHPTGPSIWKRIKFWFRRNVVKHFRSKPKPSANQRKDSGRNDEPRGGRQRNKRRRNQDQQKFQQQGNNQPRQNQPRQNQPRQQQNPNAANRNPKPQQQPHPHPNQNQRPANASGGQEPTDAQIARKKRRRRKRGGNNPNTGGANQNPGNPSTPN